MLALAPLQTGDIAEIAGAFAALGWNKPASQYERYRREQNDGARQVIVARWSDVFAGYVTIVWRSDYEPFASENIPEVSDFNVLPDFRRRRIGTALMDEAERAIAARGPVAGIGVGLHRDYGAAQRLYVLRGYVPDARGITAHGRRLSWGDDAKIDDDLVLWLTKRLF
jgi:ribosomal protein S18 acetylase RimI-like enzyme